MSTNQIQRNSDPNILFVDMNSYFATCEQQVNYWLRGRPVGVCVYTGKNGCIIAPSIEAKRKGVKTGMRLTDAMPLCPDLVPLETNPTRYRDFHVKIIQVLRKYSDDVIPKSIDEAIINLKHYKLIHKDLVKLAHQIKKDIREEVGDYMKCSIGIAPNAFLAKLASDIQKPDGLAVINEDTIDSVLSKLKLTDLPGIGHNMALRLQRAGIIHPLQLRTMSPESLRRACKSVIGLYWHYRLNFSEVDLFNNNDYKSMQAMRQVSMQNRKSPQYLEELLHSLCMTLERRMLRQNVFCKELSVFIKYGDGYTWKENIISQESLQDGSELFRRIQLKMQYFEKYRNKQLINQDIRAMGVTASRFCSGDLVQYELFDNRLRKDQLRKVVYDLKGKFGADKLIKAAELDEHRIMKDVIGFGSVKDLAPDSYWNEDY